MSGWVMCAVCLLHGLATCCAPYLGPPETTGGAEGWVGGGGSQCKGQATATRYDAVQGHENRPDSSGQNEGHSITVKLTWARTLSLAVSRLG
jgi:hypothetical protein